MSTLKSEGLLPEHAPGISQDLSHHGNVLSILINLDCLLTCLDLNKFESNIASDSSEHRAHYEVRSVVIIIIIDLLVA